MNIQFLPNWCKKVGITLFFIGVMIMLAHVLEPAFADTSDSAKVRGAKTGIRTAEFLLGTAKSPSWLEYFSKLAMLTGVLIFILAKEKFEDEYINQMRTESFQFTLLVLLGIYLLCLIFGVLKIFSGFFLFLFFIIYLLTFTIKKG